MVKPAELPAYQARVRGLVLPAPVSDEPSLEFCNSWAGWDEHGHELANGRDYAPSWEHLVALSVERGLLPADPWRDLLAGEPAGAGSVLAGVPALRAAAYRTVRGVATEHDLVLVGRLAAEGRAHQVLSADGVVGRWEMTETAGVRAPLLAAAVATADLYTSGGAARVEACGGDGCGWVFVNHSGRRRWCLMSVCGNRAKVRAFASRQR